MFRVTTQFSGTYVVGGGVTRTYFMPSSGAESDAAGAMTAFWAAVKSCIHTSTTIAVLPVVETIDPTNGEITAATAVTGSSTTGTDDGNALPPQTQGILQLRTGGYVDGREVRGRIYIPALTVSGWRDGNWVSTKRAIIETAAATLLAGGTSDWQLVVWQRERLADPDHEPNPITHRDGSVHAVSALVLAQKTAVLRSRRD